MSEIRQLDGKHPTDEHHFYKFPRPGRDSVRNGGCWSQLGRGFLLIMKDPKELTDDELFEEVRQEVNKSRNSTLGHDRDRTRKLAAEMKARGWGAKHHLEENSKP